MARIARGIRKFVIENPRPFIVPVKTWGGGGNNGRGVDEPMRTVTASKRGEFALVEPFVMKNMTNNVPRSAPREPLSTVLTGNHHFLCNPFIVRHGHYSTITGAGLREGCGAGTFRGQELDDPLATVCATNDKHLVLPFVAKHYGRGGTSGSSVASPLGTVTEKDHNSLAAAFLTKFYGTSTGSDLGAPAPTVTSGGDRGGGHLAEVRAFLLKYHAGVERDGARGQMMLEPLRTIDRSNRFALVMIAGEAYEIVDIGMRMLRPHELFAAQGFPDWYQIAPEFNGKPLTITAQTSCAGNSVSPPPAEKIVAANARAA